MAMGPLAKAIGSILGKGKVRPFAGSASSACSKFYCGGHLAAFSALPVLTDDLSAPLRFSKTPPYDSPQRIFKQALGCCQP
jgi:hypothetical protein